MPYGNSPPEPDQLRLGSALPVTRSPTGTVPKSFSVALALASPGLRAELTGLYVQAATEAVAAAEGWHARGMRGHHGDGQRAQVVVTSGLLGWLSVDPVNCNGAVRISMRTAPWPRSALVRMGSGALSSAGQDSLYGCVHALGALMEAGAQRHLPAAL